MADLPHDRLKEEPPFIHCGVDIFGPFLIKERRNTLKRYGALCTCLASRAIHIEMIKSMDTDSFILALRRFIGRRGNIRKIRCDNFVGAERERASRMLEGGQSEESLGILLQNSADWIHWKRNPPLASHMGGVWDRQIRSARNILSPFMKTQGASLDKESLNTLFVEVKGVVNSRPLVVEAINDVNSQASLSQSHILTMKLKAVMPPPGMFGTPDLYCRKKWKRVQHISNAFWSCWRK